MDSMMQRNKLYQELFSELLDPHTQAYEALLEKKLKVWKSDDYKSNFKHVYTYLVCSDVLQDGEYVEELNKIRKKGDATSYSVQDIGLKVIPTTIETLTNLTHLHLLELPITQLPQEVQQLQLLEDLVVSKCNLKRLPEWISTFGHLRTLQVDRCWLQSLPVELAACKSLTNLNVEYNRPGLRAVPAGVLKLPLQYVVLSGNPIEWHADRAWALDELAACETLCIQQTNITYLPAHLTKRLHYLSWWGCKLTTIQSCVFSSTLEYLNLCRNYLTDVSVLRNLHLHYLNVRENPIEHLDEISAEILVVK
jgi:Leucine-rich repeat (LRR) protein